MLKWLLGLVVFCAACVGVWALGSAMRDENKDENATYVYVENV